MSTFTKNKHDNDPGKWKSNTTGNKTPNGNSVNKSKTKTYLFLDWDGTLATSDTLTRIARIGYDHHGQAYDQRQPADDDIFLGIYPPGHPSSFSSSSDTRTSQPFVQTRPSWPAISNAYMADLEHFTQHHHDYKPELSSELTSPTSSVSRSKDLLNLLSFQQRTREIEERSASRLAKWGIWRAVTPTEIQNAAQDAIHTGDVVLRPGWNEAIRHVLASEKSSDTGIPATADVMPRGRVAIVSVGWSIRFIRACLALGDEKISGSGTESLQSLDAEYYDSHRDNIKDENEDFTVGIHVAANEIDATTGGTSRYFDTHGGLDYTSLSGGRRTSMRSGGIWTGEDKWRIVNALMYSSSSSAATHADANADAEPQTRSVYVGDSLGDLECLLACDVGICIRDVAEDDEPGAKPAGDASGAGTKSSTGTGKTLQILRSGQRHLAETCTRLGIEVSWVGDWAGDDTVPGGTAEYAYSREDQRVPAKGRENEREEEDDDGGVGAGVDLDIIRDIQARAQRKKYKLYWARDFGEILNSGILD